MKLKDIAAALDGELHGDGSLEVIAPCHPAQARAETDLAVAIDERLLPLLAGSAAKAAVVASGADIPEGALEGWVAVRKSRTVLAGITKTFAKPLEFAPGVHPSAVIEDGVELGADVSVGPFVFIGTGAKIGDRCVIGPNGHVGARTSIGPDGLLHAGVKIGDDVQIGARVILHFNACIGPDGFSFVTPELGSVESAKASGRVDALTTSLTRIHSLGSVELGDDVEIGANSTIDRGTLDNTRIGHGTKLDDLVMVGHNCQIGENCLLCGQVGLAGSVEVGNRVVLAGCVGVADHRKIGDDSIVGMRSGVGTDIPPRSVYVGYPAQPRSDWLKQILNLKRLGRLYKDVADLKKALDSPSS